MFDQLMDLVKQHSQDAVVNNPDVPNEQNEAVMETAGSSIMDSLKGMIGGGGAGNVMNLFNRNNADDIATHPVTQNASSDFISNLVSKFGMDSNKAGGIANSIIPAIMNKFVHKTNDPNDKSFDIQSIFNNLSGGKTGGMDISSLVSKFGGSGLDKNHDGKVDLGDLKSLFGS